MFFIGVFGIGPREKVIKDIEFKCTGCISKRASLIRVSKTFDFFFIPVFSWDKNYYVKCNRCYSVYKVREENISSILSEEVVKYSDIEEIVYEKNSCPNCGTTIVESFDFCPKCGTELNRK